jgi:hypothetical protein
MARLNISELLETVVAPQVDTLTTIDELKEMVEVAVHPFFTKPDYLIAVTSNITLTVYVKENGSFKAIDITLPS